MPKPVTPLPVGYSGTPLAKKLGYKTSTHAFLIGAPKNYSSLLAPLPEGVVFERSASPAVGLVHLFVTRKEDLAQHLAALRKKLNPAASLWVSWPKKASKLPTTITEETIREIALPMGFVDIKVCAVDETWSGFKLVVRKELRSPE